MFSLRKQFSRTIQKRLRRLHHGVLRNNTNANIVRSVSSSPPSSGKFGVHPPAHAQTGSRGMNSTAMASVTAPEHRIDNLPARLPFVVGESYHGFTLTESNATPEFGVIVYKFAHKESGAEYVHFQRDDDENFFSVGIRTPPENDKGTAHILEHMVMAGSEKYHTRNVFFNINHRSLNTMMNALTAPEFTCYPFSTQNVKVRPELLSSLHDD